MTEVQANEHKESGDDTPEGFQRFSIEEIGEVLNHRRVPLSTLERTNRQGPYPYYGASGVVDQIDGFLFEGEHVLISEDGENLSSRKTPVAFKADGEFWVNNHAHIVKCRSAALADLLVYYFANLDLHEFITGAAQPKLNKANLLSIPIILPKCTEEQTQLAATLRQLDDKIDLLRRQNQTLEAMAETLFRQWFVEEVGEQWETCTVGELFSIRGGTTPSTKDASYWDGDIAWTSPRDLAGAAGVYLFDTTRKITPLGLAQIGSGLLPPGTVLLSSRAPIGYLAITDIPVAINQGYIAMVCDDGIPNYFAYLWCKHHMDEIKAAGNGSTFEEISKSNFKALPFQVPPADKLEYFDKIASPMFSKLRSNELQIRQLEKLRDSLLPKLMSGEVRVAI